jgi:hypothetical protein
LKYNKIQNETFDKVESIRNELNTKLTQFDKEKDKLIKTATNFGWLAILVISLLILINILIDCQKLVCNLKKYYCRNINNRLSKATDQSLSLNKQKNVFKQVIEKDHSLANHSYFQNRRNLNKTIIC